MISQRSRGGSRVLGYALGLALIAGAAVMAMEQINTSAMVTAELWKLVAIATAVVGNLVLTAGLFWIITLSFDAVPPVRLGRMTCLISVSALLNFLPLRPGLLGRAAYLKQHHALPLHQSVWILLSVLATGIVVLATSTLIVLAVPAWWNRLAMALTALAALTAITGPTAHWLLRRRISAAYLWIPLRTADMLLAALRLWLAFWIVQEPIAFDLAIVAGAAAVLVNLAGITPNGLGVREWVVAALVTATAQISTEAGLAAAIVDRAVEATAVAMAGLVSLHRLRWR